MARKVGISIQELDRPCSHDHLLPISQHLPSWSTYADYLGLTRVHLENIETDIRFTVAHTKGYQMLLKWQEINCGCGEPNRKNTYRYLLRGCIKIHSDLEVVRDICRLVKEQPV